MSAAMEGLTSSYGAALGVSLQQPRTRGSVRLASADPLAKPTVHYNYFEDPHDLEAVVRGSRYRS